MNRSRMFRTQLPLLLCLCGAFFAGEARAQQPKPNDSDQLLKELMGEVRLLRQTLQRINLTTYRSQIIIERIRAQNEQVSRTSRSLDDVRAEIANLQVGGAQFTERAKAVESQLQQESDEKRREGLETELKELKYVAEQHKQKEQRARERESQLSEQLRLEQAKQNDLENRLDLLERELMNEMEKQEPEDKNREKKRPQ